MNPYYRLKALTHYPELAQQASALKHSRNKNPGWVLEEFFDMYHLAGIRDSLKLWLDDTPNSKRKTSENMFIPVAWWKNWRKLLILNPLQVLNHFCKQFTAAYIREELWDLLDSAITSGNETDRFYLLLYYQCLSTLTEAARYLSWQKKRCLNRTPSLQKPWVLNP